MLSIIPAHLITLGLAWVIVTRAGKRPFLHARWEWGAGFTFWRSAGLAVLLLLVGIAIAKLTGPADNALEHLIRSSRAATLAVAFVASITAPLVEEILRWRPLLGAPAAGGRGRRGRLRRHHLRGHTRPAVLAELRRHRHHPPAQPRAHADTRAHGSTACFIVHLVFNSIQAVFMVLDPYLKRFSPEEAAPAPGMLFELFARIFGG